MAQDSARVWVQIFGRTRSFDTQKAERFFRERKIAVQRVDLDAQGLSRRELSSVLTSVGSLDALIDTGTRDQDAYARYRYLPERDRFTFVLDHPALVIAPVVRCGHQATVGYQPDVWRRWLATEALSEG